MRLRGPDCCECVLRHRAGHPLGRCSGLPRFGGTAWISGISWVTSLRLPPVVIAASRMPCASTVRWCLLPALPRSTGDGPVASPPSARGCGWSPPLRGRSPAGLRPAARTAARALPDPASFQSRSRRQQVIPEPKPSFWGRNSRRIRRTARTGPRTAPCDHPDAHDLNAADYAGRRAAAATIRAHNSSSISHGLAASSSSRPARTPFGPATTRTDTPSFP